MILDIVIEKQYIWRHSQRRRRRWLWRGWQMIMGKKFLGSCSLEKLWIQRSWVIKPISIPSYERLSSGIYFTWRLFRKKCEEIEFASNLKIESRLLHSLSVCLTHRAELNGAAPLMIIVNREYFSAHQHLYNTIGSKAIVDGGGSLSTYTRVC